ncbi:hypothetical protein DFH27DRAFT_477645 [Peziza echinospora]|nr:hypothetical protein DFH27DRAFT_477645 [Peziza echinospora]
MLPDIAETSPITPTPVRPPIRAIRPLSIQSLLSDGTIEVDGFGFLEENPEDNDSEEYDTWDLESTTSPSLYEGSVYDGYGGENDDGRVTPSTLSRRAERVLENAKKKLDLCGQNLTRARHSLVLSPPGSSLSRYSDTDSETTIGENRISPQLPPSAISASHLRTMTHYRTVSESAVPTAYNLKRANSDRSTPEENVPAQGTEVTRSQSAQQMRSLRDQMKDLRGKISNLQQQTQTDSLRRRSSNNLKTARAYQNNLPNPVGRETPTWEEEEDGFGNRQSAYPDSIGSSRASTPKPLKAQRESRHEDREDAFSYDSLFLGNGIYAPPHSDVTETGYQNKSPTTSEKLRQVISPLKRGDSFTSLSSYATADDGGFRSPSSAGSLNSTSSSSSSHAAARAVARASSSRLRASPTHHDEDKGRDDGYHSAPHTPRGAAAHQKSSGLSSSSPPTVITPSSSSTTLARSSSSSSSLRHQVGALPQRRSRIISGAAGIEVLGDGEVLTTASSPGRAPEVSLRLAEEDRYLIERLIEELGKTCCAMECADNESDVAVYRRKLITALRVFEV